MQTFKYGKTRSTVFSTAVNEAEMAIVRGPLSRFTTKTQAITYLHFRGWSTKDICNIIHYDDNRPLLAPHVNQVRQKARAGTKMDPVVQQALKASDRVEPVETDEIEEFVETDENDHSEQE